MLRAVFLLLIAIMFLSCDYLTDDTETEPETSPVAPAPANWEALLQDRGNWELLATLKRDVRQDFWHEFYLEPDTETLILQAFLDGKEFLFVIEHPDRSFSRPVQFYFAQPEGLGHLYGSKGLHTRGSCRSLLPVPTDVVHALGTRNKRHRWTDKT